MFVIPSILFKI